VTDCGYPLAEFGRAQLDEKHANVNVRDERLSLSPPLLDTLAYI
jgi:hypothetical protein